MNQKHEEDIASLAQDILLLTQKKLIIRMRFLSPAIRRLGLKADKWPLYTNGKMIYYDPHLIISLYRENPQKVMQAYLHMLLHCIFSHGSEGLHVEKRYWNIACDLAVEHVISGMGIVSCQHTKMLQLLDRYSQQVETVTAERLYHYFRNHPPAEHELWELERYTQFDYHDGWYQERIDAKTKDSWKELAQHISMELSEFAAPGQGSSLLQMNLKESLRDHYDYESFLRQFMRQNEMMKTDDEAFDYIFYTYGLQQYENMPLIEPLEYRDRHKISEFVIAIDTSGSVQGELLKMFLRKTCRILMTSRSFEEKVNIHILQCDDKVQEDVKLTTTDEMNAFIEHFSVLGGGGTDFRPVFDHVETLIRTGEFKDLQGLIYFTDGYGSYPRKVPGYKTVFVFVKDEVQAPKVPVWAIRLVMPSEEMDEILQEPVDRDSARSEN